MVFFTGKNGYTHTRGLRTRTRSIPAGTGRVYPRVQVDPHTSIHYRVNTSVHSSLTRSHSRSLAASWDPGWLLVNCSTETLTSCSVCRTIWPVSSAIPTAQHQLDHCYGACTGCQSGSDQLQTRQTLLPGYCFPIATLPRWSDQPIESVLLATIIHTEVSVSSTAQFGHCCSSFLSGCSETLELSSTELSNCFIR